MHIDRARFDAEGYLAPLRLLSAADCAALVRSLADAPPPAPAVWDKGRWINDRRCFDLATSAPIRSLMTGLLGPNVVLWGVQFAARGTNRAHPWHVDIEAMDPEGGFATVWLGLENTSRESALNLISHSHRCAAPLQKLLHDHGMRRGEADTPQLLAWARERNAEAALVQPDVSDGDAIVFDGRLWHGSNNQRAGDRRLAILFQYARADRPVRIPDFSRLEWPLADHDRPRAPVIAVSGKADPRVNWVVTLKTQPAPAEPGAVYDLALPLVEDADTGWAPRPVFTRSTPAVDRMSCHVSVLSAGRCPHPPHRHDDEEILVMLDGEAELVMQHPERGEDLLVLKAKRGAAMFYPAHFAHTIRNASDRPATYLMFKWTARGVDAGAAAAKPVLINTAALPKPDLRQLFCPTAIFEQPTRYLDTLGCHISDLKPGGVVAPHHDEHDTAMIVLSGRLDLLGRDVGENAVVYSAAGEVHGFRNNGPGDARYLVFELRPHRTRAARLTAA